MLDCVNEGANGRTAVMLSDIGGCSSLDSRATKRECKVSPLIVRDFRDIVVHAFS